MILALLIASAIYAVTMWGHGSTVTPDGVMYLAIGRGERVPRPYSLRLIARIVRTAGAWRVVHAVSYLLFIGCVYAAVFHVSASAALPVASSIAALPSVRASVSWPVLVDMPSWAAIALCAAIAPHVGVWVVVAIALSGITSERTPLFATLACLPMMDMHTALSAGVVAVMVAWSLWLSAPDVHSEIPWLRHPIREAIAHHRTAQPFLAWVLPWGGATLSIPHFDLSTWLALAVAYAQSIVAQDRARLYTYAAVPVALAMAHADPVALWTIAGLTIITPITEV